MEIPARAAFETALGESPMLEIDNAVRRFATTPAVQGVSIQVAPGRVTSLLGPSGCGKSTTLRLIAGIERLDAGTIRIDGQLVADARFSLPPEKRPVGMVFQDLALFPHMTVAENVAFGMPGPNAARTGSTRCWNAWAWPVTGRNIRICSRAGNSSAWR